MNVGLHHRAFKVTASPEKSNDVYDRLKRADNVRIECAPEPLRDGPTVHKMCYERGRMHVELIVPARNHGFKSDQIFIMMKKPRF